MFKIVLPNNFPPSSSVPNRFELIYSDESSINQRRSYSTNLLYPNIDLKQCIGRKRKALILNGKREKFKHAQQQLRASKQNSSVISFNKTQSIFNVATQSRQETSKATLSKESTRKGSQKLHLPKSISLQSRENLLAVQSQMVHKMSKTSLRFLSDCEIPIPEVKEDSPFGTIVKVKSSGIKKKSYFDRDLLDQAKMFNSEKDTPQLQGLFTNIINKIISRMEQWELFEDKQIVQALEAYEILYRARAVALMQSTNSIERILVLIADENMPMKIRVPLLKSLESQSKLPSYHSLLISHPQTLSTLFDLLRLNESAPSTEGELLGEISLKILTRFLQIDWKSTHHVPKVSKEKEDLKVKAYESGILTKLVEAYLEGAFEKMIEAQVISQLSSKDIKQYLILTQMPNSPEIMHNLKVNEFLKTHLDKIQTDQKLQYEREFEQRMRQTQLFEQEEKKRVEAREAKKKLAEELFFKRLEEKQRRQAEEARKQSLQERTLQTEKEEIKQTKLELLQAKMESRKMIEKRKKNSIGSNDFSSYVQSEAEMSYGRLNLSRKAIASGEFGNKADESGITRFKRQKSSFHSTNAKQSPQGSSAVGYNELIVFHNAIEEVREEDIVFKTENLSTPVLLNKAKNPTAKLMIQPNIGLNSKILRFKIDHKPRDDAFFKQPDCTSPLRSRANNSEGVIVKKKPVKDKISLMHLPNLYHDSRVQKETPINLSKKNLSQDKVRKPIMGSAYIENLPNSRSRENQSYANKKKLSPLDRVSDTFFLNTENKTFQDYQNFHAKTRYVPCTKDVDLLIQALIGKKRLPSKAKLSNIHTPDQPSV